MTWHNNMAFTTSDVDNDVSESNCAVLHHSGWWYRDCARSNLNGVYYRQVSLLLRNNEEYCASQWPRRSYEFLSEQLQVKTQKKRTDTSVCPASGSIVSFTSLYSKQRKSDRSHPLFILYGTSMQTNATSIGPHQNLSNKI